MQLDSIKNITILGSGESGVGAAVLAKLKGFEVFLSDSGSTKEKYQSVLSKYDIDHEQGKHSEQKILRSGIVIKSPGISNHADIIKKVKAKNIPVCSEIELGYHFKGGAKLIAVTGSNGKTTTSCLTHHILACSGYHSSLVGNVGDSFCYALATQKKPDWYVVEVSSFQLDDIYSFRPEIAVLLNITPDHLDRYNDNIDEYADAKMKIIKNQNAEDTFIYNDDDEIIKKKLYDDILSQKKPFSMYTKPNLRAFVIQHKLQFKEPDYKVWDMLTSDIPLKGKHNHQNVMASTLATSSAGVSKEKIRNALQSFKGIDHRLESVKEVEGVEFINDSKATNVNSTWYALECMSKPTILIMGGMDKGNNYKHLKKLVKSKVKAIVCLGKENGRIIETFQTLVPCVETDSAKEAVKQSFEIGKKGDVVLLSPACSSFDLFRNFEDRGNQFKEAVNQLSDDKF